MKGTVFLRTMTIGCIVFGLLFAMSSLVDAKPPKEIMWSFAGPIKGMRCTKISEPKDPHTWHDNYLCVPKKSRIVLKWSSSGPLTGGDKPISSEQSDKADSGTSTGKASGMRCTHIVESADPHWRNNYLCVPRSSRIHFKWSSSGPIGGLRCLRIHEPSDPHTWHDNYLCWK